MRNRSKATIAVATTAIVALAICNVYLIREHNNGTVLWSANEAYLFIGYGREGVRVKCLLYPWSILKENLGVIADPDDQRASLCVIRVTPSGVERHVLSVEDHRPGAGPGLYTPLEGQIYVNYPALGGLCRWAGDHFEKATPEERQRLGGIYRLTTGDMDNRETGWSRRAFGTGPGDAKLTIDVGHKFGISVRTSAAGENTNGTALIDLLRDGKAPERIWDFYARRGRISRTEYWHAFQDRE
jgi:hypothetical protein